MSSLVITAAVAPLVVGLLQLFNSKRKPEWVEELSTPWERVNWFASGASFLAIVITLLLYQNWPLLPSIAAVGGSGLLTYCLTQSLFTDPQVRRVDRKTLYFSIVSTFAVNFAILSQDSRSPFFLIYIIFCFVGAILIFLPLLMGASDGRAILLVVTASLPILGLDFFVKGWIGFLALLVVYVIWVSARKAVGQKDSLSLFFKTLVGKMSLPAVPFILAPFTVLTVFLPLL